MEINVETQENCLATVKASLSAGEVASRRDRIANAYASQVKIPGFRPGKTPLKIVTKRFASEINEELKNAIQSDIADQALVENPSLKVLNIAPPSISDFTDDGSFTYEAQLTIVPDFTLPKYKGIEVTAKSDEVTDAEVDEALAKYADQMAEHEPVERAVAMGDVAVIDFTTSVEGQPTAELLDRPVGFLEGRDGHWLFVDNDDFMPGLSEGIVGSSVGDKKDITVHIPEGFPLSELVGKDLVFHVEVKEVREKVAPVVDAAFIEKIAPGKTMEEVRERLTEMLKENKKREIQENMADQISEYLADALDFELPASLVERESFNILQNKMREAMQAGKTDFAALMDEFRADAQKETKRNLKVYFMLQEIAQKEEISAQEQEIYTAIVRMAEQEKEKNMKTFVRKLQKEGRIQGIRMSLVTSKTLDFLVENAKVTISE